MTGVIPFLKFVVFCALLHIVIIRTQLMPPAIAQGRKVSRHWIGVSDQMSIPAASRSLRKFFSPINLVCTYPFAIQIRGRRTRRATLLGRTELGVGVSTYEGPEKKSHDRPAKPGDQQWARSDPLFLRHNGAVRCVVIRRTGDNDLEEKTPVEGCCQSPLQCHILYGCTLFPPLTNYTTRQFYWIKFIESRQLRQSKDTTGSSSFLCIIKDTLVWRCWYVIDFQEEH